MTNFLKFHINLILSNKTTIEFLEKKGEPFESAFNISPMHNWKQVFGSDVLLWFFPVSFASGHPIGDGIIWPTNPAVRRGSNVNANQAQSAQKSPTPDRVSKNSELQPFVRFIWSYTIQVKNDDEASDKRLRSPFENKENISGKFSEMDSREKLNGSKLSLSKNSGAWYINFGLEYKFNGDYMNQDQQLETIVNRKGKYIISSYHFGSLI